MTEALNNRVRREANRYEGERGHTDDGERGGR